MNTIHFYIDSEEPYVWKCARIAALSWRRNGWDVKVLKPWKETEDGRFHHHAMRLWVNGAREVYKDRWAMFMSVWGRFDAVEKYHQETGQGVLLSDMDVINYSWTPWNFSLGHYGAKEPHCFSRDWICAPMWFPAGCMDAIFKAYKEFDYNSIEPRYWLDDNVGKRCQKYTQSNITRIYPHEWDPSRGETPPLVHFPHYENSVY